VSGSGDASTSTAICTWITFRLITLNSSINILQARISKYVTNGGKTDVMQVIRFLCVSVGSSAVQLHDSLSSRRSCACSVAGFSSQNGDRA
jgi:hypothetical protein